MELVTEYQQVTERVKRCNGKQCWFENVTKTVPVKVWRARKAARVVNLPAKVSTYSVNVLTNTELVPTPYSVVETMLRILKPTTKEVLYDIGCGDGRFIVSAAKDYGCTAVGIELNPESAKLARQRAVDQSVSSKVMIFESDAQTLNYLGADIAVMYLYPELMENILPRLRPGCRVASYIHEIPNMKTTKYTVDDHVFYVGIKQ